MSPPEIFMRSISGGTPESTEALWLGVFLTEIRRQAELGSRFIKRAWMRAMSEETRSDDTMVWGDLQAALFSAIVIQRTLKPGPVRPYPKETREARQKQAEHRGNRLRELLKVDESWPLFLAKDVRDACEHFDEKLDSVILGGTASLVDWHISHDGKMLQTPPRPTAGQEIASDLRAFYPRGGKLRFSSKYELDVFNLDVAFLNLLEPEGVDAAEARLNKNLAGPMTFGAAQYIYMMSEEDEDLRLKQWLNVHEQAGSALPLALAAKRFHRDT